MKKVLLSLFSLGVLVSCGNSIEKDAKKMAELMCQTYDEGLSQSEKNEFLKEIEEIEQNYPKEERNKLQNLAEELFISHCGQKVAKSLSKNEQLNKDNLGNNDEDYQDTIVGDEDFDKLLDDYERLVDDMIVVMNKMSNNDMSLMTDYPKLMADAQSFEKRLQEANKNGQLSTEQIKRMNSISLKMLKVMENNSVDVQNFEKGMEQLNNLIK